MIKTDKVIYRTRTQEEYDWLIDKLDKAGCMWIDGEFPTESNVFFLYGSNTHIFVDGKKLTYGGEEEYTLSNNSMECIEVSDLKGKEQEVNQKIGRTIEAIRYIARLLGFDIKGRIVLVDIKTGEEGH